MTDAEAPEDRRSYFVDIAIALLLGIAAIATAWAAYQSSLFGGDELEAFNRATVKTSEAALASDQASQAWTEGDQAYIQDQQLFFEYVKAAQTENLDLALYLRESLMSPELVSAIEWWEDTPDDVTTPFTDENPNYTNVAWDNAAALDEDAQALLDEASLANEEANEKGDTGDKYDFATVLLAASLFMLGIGGVFRELMLKIALGSMGTIFLIVALVQVAGLDRA